MSRKNGKVSDLAKNIAEIMQNPITPTNLYNAIADALNDMAGQSNRYNPEFVECVLGKDRTLEPSSVGT
jgi:hypothetical protein